MIEASDYMLPKREHKRKKSEVEEQAARDNEDVLYGLDFRPFGYEW